MAEFQFYAAIANMVFFLLFAGVAWRKMARAKAEAATLTPNDFGAGRPWVWTMLFWLSLFVATGWAITLYWNG